MPRSHLCVESPRVDRVLGTSYGKQSELRDIEEDAHVDSFWFP